MSPQIRAHILAVTKRAVQKAPSHDPDQLEARRVHGVMSQSVEANGFEFYFQSEKFDPPIGQGSGRLTHEVKVIRIYDRVGGNQRIFDDFVTGRWPCNGKDERDAFEKCAGRATEWADSQPGR